MTSNEEVSKFLSAQKDFNEDFRLLGFNGFYNLEGVYHENLGGFTVVIKDINAARYYNRICRRRIGLNDFTQAAVITDHEMVVVDINEELSRISGYKPDEVYGKSFPIFSSGYHDDLFYKDMLEILISTGVWSGIIWNKKKDSSIYLQQLTICEILDSDGNLTYYLGVFSGVSEAMLLKNDNYFGGLNRDIRNNSALNDLHMEFDSLKLLFEKFYLVTIEIYRYQILRDVYGVYKADELILACKATISDFLPSDKFLYQTGCNKISFFSTSPSEYSLKKIISVVRMSLEIVDTSLCSNLGVKIGVSAYPNDGDDIYRLISASEMAVDYHNNYYNKRDVQLYDSSSFSEKDLSTINYENELQNAEKKRELNVEYQPIVSSDNNLIKIEALLRWESKVFGNVSPNIFIPISEKNELIHALGLWVINKALSDIRMLNEEYNTDYIVSINVSTVQLLEPNFYEEFSKSLSLNRVKPSWVEIEFIESVFIRNSRFDACQKVLHKIRRLGVKVALDGFGAGCSSLSYLTFLPLDTLKIDRSFVKMLDDSSEVKTLSSIIKLAHELELEVVAEGIELERQQEILKELSCDYFQGYLHSKPKEIEQIRVAYCKHFEQVIH